MVGAFGRRKRRNIGSAGSATLAAYDGPSPRGHIFRSNKATTSAIEHLKEQHRIGRDGALKAPEKKEGKRTIDALLEDGYDAETAAENRMAIAFDHSRWKSEWSSMLQLRLCSF